MSQTGGTNKRCYFINHSNQFALTCPELPLHHSFLSRGFLIIGFTGRNTAIITFVVCLISAFQANAQTSEAVGDLARSFRKFELVQIATSASEGLPETKSSVLPHKAAATY